MARGWKEKRVRVIAREGDNDYANADSLSRHTCKPANSILMKLRKQTSN